jgi:hypothetical protein
MSMCGSRMRLPFVVAALLASTAIPAATLAVAAVSIESWIRCTHGPAIGMPYELEPDDAFPPWNPSSASVLPLYYNEMVSKEGVYHSYGYFTADGYFREVNAYTDNTDSYYDYTNVKVYKFENGERVYIGYEDHEYGEYGEFIDAGFYDQYHDFKIFHGYTSDISPDHDYWYTWDEDTERIVGAAGAVQRIQSRLPIATVFADLGGGLGGNILGGSPQIGPSSPRIDISGGSTPYNPPLNFTGTSYTDQVPDVIGSLRVDQAWGSAQISGALNQIRGGFYGTSGLGSGADKASRGTYSAYYAYYAYYYGDYSGYYGDHSGYYDYYSSYYNYYSSYNDYY